MAHAAFVSGKRELNEVLAIDFISESKLMDESIIILSALYYEAFYTFATDLANDFRTVFTFCTHALSLMFQHCTKVGQLV